MIKTLISKLFSKEDDFTNYVKSLELKSNLSIIDVGAHKGQTSLYLNKVFPNSVIHAFEPSSSLFKQLSSNLKNEKM